MTDEKRETNAAKSTRKTADEIAGEVLDKNVNPGDGDGVDYYCSGTRFDCSRSYSCKAPDSCDNDFRCGTYKEANQT